MCRHACFQYKLILGALLSYKENMIFVQCAFLSVLVDYATIYYVETGSRSTPSLLMICVDLKNYKAGKQKQAN